MIGVTRRILESILADLRPKHFTHEVLSTLMVEVMAIVNAKPLLPVPTDPDAPEIPTPAILLAQKSQSLKAKPGNVSCQQTVETSPVLGQPVLDSLKRGVFANAPVTEEVATGVKNLKEGDLVLLWCKETPRNGWPLVRITHVCPSSDGNVRKVDLVTGATQDQLPRSFY